VAFDESLAERIRHVLARKNGVEDDGQVKEWIERATKFVKLLPAK